MRAIKKVTFTLSLLLLSYSCGKDSKLGDLPGLNNLKPSDTDNQFLPTDLKSVTIGVHQENGDGFTISSVQENNKGEPVVEDGRILFDVSYETFTGSYAGLSLKTEIFSLVANGFVQQSFSQPSFAIIMSPGIYILTVTVSKGTLNYPPFKAKMVVKCAKSLQDNTFTVDASKVKILPVAEFFWSAKNRWVYFGKFSHDLSEVVTQVPAGANLNRYSYDMDSNGDGSLQIVNGAKIDQVGYGIDIINRNIFSPTIAYSTFADNQRSVVYEIYDECYNSKSIEVATGNNGIFGITEKEDVYASNVMPAMKDQNPSSEPEDPSYMVQHKMNFLQQAQTQINVPGVDCDQRVGGVNYPAGCDPRLTGTLSLIESPRASVTCNISGSGSLSVKAEEVLPGQKDGYNYNLIDRYSAYFTIGSITKKYNNNYPYWDPSNARINNYTYTVPGAGDQIGKEVLLTTNCSVKVLLPQIDQSFSACGAGYDGTGTYTTIQHVRVAYKCDRVLSNSGKEMRVAGELYCKNGIVSTKSDCVNNNPPSGPPGGPLPPSPPPPIPDPQ